MDSLLIKAMKMQSLDNLSVVMIGLQGFKNALAEAWEAKQQIQQNTINPMTNDIISSKGEKKRYKETANRQS